MVYKFPNIAQSGALSFLYETEASFTEEPTSGHFRALNYGDRYAYSVGPNHLADYLASLAEAMLADRTLGNTAVSVLMDRPSVESIQFAASLVCKPTDLDGSKPRFWSLDQRTVSSSLSKQHDKRYRRFADWMDGSPAAILRTLTPDYGSPFLRYCRVEAVRDWVLTQNEGAMEMPGLYVGWFDDHHRARRLHAAYSLALCAAQAVQHRESALSQLDGYRHNFTLPVCALPL